MKDNVYFKTARGVQLFTLLVSPWVAAILAWKGDYRMALLALAGWAMIVTSMLTIRKPKGISDGE